MEEFVVKVLAFLMMMGTGVLIFEDPNRYPFGYPLLIITVPVSYLCLKYLYKRTGV